MTALYRHFNAAGSLLYVGIADDHHVRFKAHLRFADWKDQIATVKIERFTTREEAHAAEVVAIRSEGKENVNAKCLEKWWVVQGSNL